jgi:hypothetical protein
MAAETPFGASFGDPRRYMGQSPLAEIGKALKTGGILYGLQKSGAIEALDQMGIKSDGKGGFNLPQPAGSVPPATRSMGAQPVAPQQFGAVPPAPMAPMVPAALGPQITPLPDSGPSNVQINTFAPPPPDAGRQILDGTFKPQSSAVDVTNQTDFNTFVPDTGNQVALTGNEYQQTPGFGSSKDKAGKLMKIMGMG